MGLATTAFESAAVLLLRAWQRQICLHIYYSAMKVDKAVALINKGEMSRAMGMPSSLGIDHLHGPAITDELRAKLCVAAISVRRYCGAG